MYCPNCGSPEQAPETFCRRCGIFLPDLERIKPSGTSPEMHIKMNSVFSLMSAIISCSLAIAIYATYGSRANTPFIVYLTAAFLVAMTAWQVQVFVRSRKLKKQFEELRPNRGSEKDERTFADGSRKTADLLEEADLSDVVPPSVTERTTRNLTSTKAKH